MRTVAVMERKRAWITAGVVAVSFITSALAVMANTGLLSIGPSDRNIGRLTPVDITLGSTQPSSSAAVQPGSNVRHQDVYVTVPADGPALAPDATKVLNSLAKTAGPVPGPPRTPTSAGSKPVDRRDGDGDDD